MGAGVTKLVGDVIQQHGGVAGLISQFEQKGMGNVVQSWVGTGANLPVTADQIHRVLGSNTVTQLAAKFGLNPDDIPKALSEALPQAVDKMTPNGAIPKA